jgi:hypothetical protein
LLLATTERRDEDLAMLISFMANNVRRGENYGHGHTMTSTDYPLWPDSQFSSLLWSDTSIVPAVELEDEVISFELLIPVFPDEVALNKEIGPNGLRERWIKHGVDFLDLSRQPVPLE